MRKQMDEMTKLMLALIVGFIFCIVCILYLYYIGEKSVKMYAIKTITITETHTTKAIKDANKTKDKMMKNKTNYKHLFIVEVSCLPTNCHTHYEKDLVELEDLYNYISSEGYKNNKRRNGWSQVTLSGIQYIGERVTTK